MTSPMRRVAWFGLAVALAAGGCAGNREDRLTRLVTRGNGYLEAGRAAEAVDAYRQALRIAPNSPEIRLNLANAFLLDQDPAGAIEQCRHALELDAHSAAAYYLLGCAHARRNEFEQAVQAFQQSQQIDAFVTALNFQLGLAHAQLEQLPEALEQLELAVEFEPDHLSAWYQLSRLYARLGREAEAEAALARHQEVLAAHPAPPGGPARFEQCKHTEPLLLFRLALPARRGNPVRFEDATAEGFGPVSGTLRGPVAMRRDQPDGALHLLALGPDGMQPLVFADGTFGAAGDVLPTAADAGINRILVGDLDNDRYEDVIALGDQATFVYRFAAHGQAADATAYSGLQDVRAADGVLADLDFTGKLDVLAVIPDGGGLQVLQNRGSFFFRDQTAESGLPARLPGATQVWMEDWFNQDLPGVFVALDATSPPAYYAKQRAGAFVPTNLTQRLPAGARLSTADMDNDLRADLLLADADALHLVYSGERDPVRMPLRKAGPAPLWTVDYDNDGWLDVIAGGRPIRVWRNLGPAGLADVTDQLGLASDAQVVDLAAADFDDDGDTDLVLATDSGLQYWRNRGGNAHGQVKLRLTGNRSNASALGVRAELVAGNWRTIRTRRQGPLEIGVGDQAVVDLIQVRWFDTVSTLVDTPVQPEPVVIDELILPTGSCPYLYAWDGAAFRFVTDMLGAAPLGLPQSKTRLIEADVQEYLALGGPDAFPPRDGRYEVRITEELREVLYLDVATLVAVDHPEDTLVCATSKMVPAKPWPPAAIRTLRPVAPLRHAERDDGLDVTDALAAVDRRMASPVRLRPPQLRGLAEPFAMTLDFGPLPVDRPLALVMTGWLLYGGGMANVAASLDATLPFPFPTLEAEVADGAWTPVDVVVGAPAGKTKTMLVDLDGNLPAGTRRLRLTTAFEIHWDAIRLCETVSSESTITTRLPPHQADLRWRGYSRNQDLPPDQPLSPDYQQVTQTAYWRHNVSGWVTRYGPVRELLTAQDNHLVLINAGDELAVRFDGEALPPLAEGMTRDFFLYCVGWDKDADFHVRFGWTVDPLPFHGMDDQAYGFESRPAAIDDAWIRDYNTRWVGPRVLSRPASPPPQGDGPA